MEKVAHTFWSDKGLRYSKKKKKNFERIALMNSLCFHSAVSLGRSLSSGPCAGGREKRSSEPSTEDVVALLHHQGRRTFALQVWLSGGEGAGWVWVGGIKMNSWMDGGWGQRSGVATEVLSGESHASSGGVAEVFSNKKRGPAHFILSWGSRTSVTYQRNSRPIHLLSLRVNRVVL